MPVYGLCTRGHKVLLARGAEVGSRMIAVSVRLISSNTLGTSRSPRSDRELTRRTKGIQEARPGAPWWTRRGKNLKVVLVTQRRSHDQLSDGIQQHAIPQS